MFDILKDIEGRITDPVVFYFILGLDFRESGKYIEAIEAWKRVLEFLSPSSEIRVIIYSQISLLFREMGHINETLAWLEKAYETDHGFYKDEIKAMIDFVRTLY